ncbi:2Fe-2S iron-sulfur cluster-binding protein [Streptomyces formicae]|uniref:Xanthine dehydrogenase iron-sulfur subunit n=1 Tax=Streptomyces formicae TaxID=1616117 RepID=A0A291Q9E3_9ACTN|nr:2Fe-2S iron-sulfur cluster-binding protein [Streptomyces formicae]ATL28117.1 Xanthine dehydrogenase iron-sulfur subunit [Streptomyces formicae]
MSDDQNTHNGGGWQPHPQGEYDSDATAFVQLPEGMLDVPLAAPGHGYVPPQIKVTPTTADATDPAATGTWVMPPEITGAMGGGQAVSWPEAGTAQSRQVPESQPQGHVQGQGYDPRATGQWSFPEAHAAEQGYGPEHGHTQGHGHAHGYEQPHEQPHEAASDVTGQWSIPVADGDLPDESGEFTTSSLATWGGTPPATLPGGAAAPWATGAGAGAPWGAQAQEAPVLEPEPEVTAPPQEHHVPDHHVPEHHVSEPHVSEPHVPEYRAPESHAPVQEGPPENRFEQTTLLRAVRVPSAAEREAAEHPEVQEPQAQEVQEAQEVRQELQELQEAPEPGPAEADALDQPVLAEPVLAEPALDQPVLEQQDAHDEFVEPEPPVDDVAEAPAPAPEAVAEEPTGPEPEPDAEPEAEPAEPAILSAPLHDDHPLVSYVLRVNGADRPVTDAWIGESLLYVLRERLGLAGAKDGCSQGECGACNVQVDGRLVASCLVPAATTASSEVRTVEGLAEDGQPSDVQRALAACGAVQCGFCVPGMAMTLHDLLEGNPAPTDLETRRALCGNLCRCSGYRGVLDAVQEVVAEREATAAAASAAESPDEPGDQARIPHQAGPGAGGVHQAAHEGIYEEPEGSQGPYGRDGGQA